MGLVADLQSMKAMCCRVGNLEHELSPTVLGCPVASTLHFCVLKNGRGFATVLQK